MAINRETSTLSKAYVVFVSCDVRRRKWNLPGHLLRRGSENYYINAPGQQNKEGLVGQIS